MNGVSCTFWNSIVGDFDSDFKLMNGFELFRGVTAWKKLELLCAEFPGL